jgi:peptidoglycan hydrolase-like protein with peptidoglycan-binding domain
MLSKTIADTVNKPLFKGRITASHRSGIDRIVRAWEQYGYGLDTALAVVLATSYWETAHRMQPVRETLATTDAGAIRALDKAFNAGKMTYVKTPYWRTGFFGRGDVQLTHEANYSGPMRDAVLSKFGVDIHAHPEKALDPDISAFIMIEGMTKGVTLKGDFTVSSLEQFVNEQGTDYVQSRKVVNPGDKKSFAEIAAIAGEFEAGIRAARKEAKEEFKGPLEVNIYDGRKHPEIENVQKLLDEKGYPEVGSIDGKYGGQTAAAIMNFRRRKGLPLTDKIDDAFLAALVQDEGRPIAPERANATLADLRDKGAEDVKKTDNINWTGKGLLGLGVLEGAQKGAAQLQQYSDVAKQVTDALSPFMGFFNTYWPMIALGVGGFVIYESGALNKIRLFKHQTAKDVSE